MLWDKDLLAQDAIIQVLTDLNICPVERTILEQAIPSLRDATRTVGYANALNFRDFEDVVQYACGLAHGVDAILTIEA